MRFFLSLLALLAWTAFAEPEKTLSLADLPPLAQKTIRQYVGKDPISEVERRTLDGETVYDRHFYPQR